MLRKKRWGGGGGGEPAEERNVYLTYSDQIG